MAAVVVEVAEAVGLCAVVVSVGALAILPVSDSLLHVNCHGRCCLSRSGPNVEASVGSCFECYHDRVVVDGP